MALLGSITNRIFLASTLLATLSIAAAVYFVSARMTRETESELQRDLAEAATFVDEQRQSQIDNVTRTARLIADLPKFKAVVDIGDRPTLQPIAADYQQQAGADLLIVTGRHGELMALAGDPSTRAALDDGPLPAVPRDGSVAPVFWPHPRGVLEVVSVPVTLGLERPDVLGTLSIGYLLDERRAIQFKTLTGADIAFAADGAVRASTLGAEAAAALAAQLPVSGPDRLVLGGDEFVAVSRPLGGSADAGAPIAVVLRSRSQRMRTLASIQRALAGIALGAALLAVGVSYLVARTITRPLATITDHMRHVAATGDLSRTIATKDGGWYDDDAHMLATTFNSLTESVARFQREAAERERLSSLGRLSTVIAHEVRNPLMIIKGALRSLGRDDASPADVREAARDIDEEINRLGRLVNDVLDVARPIRIERAPTDVNAVCRAAAAAAQASRAEPAIELRLADGVRQIASDGERLRTVLVNLLTNAQHATEAAGRAPQPVRLATERAGGARVAIVVADAGTGIAGDDLPRIFDPYFTTRRAGTGLGLAIARNIVDGLGGVMTVRTTPGEGTEFRIELGDAPGHPD